MRSLQLILLFSVCTSGLFAQTKQEWLEYAEQAFERGDHRTAASHYLKVLDEDVTDERKQVHPYQAHRHRGIEKGDSSEVDSGASRQVTRSLYVSRRIAESYHRAREYDKALEWYEKLQDIEDGMRTRDRLLYAEVLMEQGDHSKALEKLGILKAGIEEEGLSRWAQRLIEGCEFALEEDVENETMRVKRTEGVVNEGTSDMAARFTDEIGSLIFTSARVGNRVGEDEEPRKGKFSTDIYMADLGSGAFDDAENIGPPVNSEDLEGAAVLSDDGKKLYFTRCDKEDPTDCGIYLSRKLGGRWLKPMLMSENVNVEGYSSKHPILAEDERMLYFASDRPGGEGKMDLWSVPLDARGMAGKPMHLGPKVNTSGNELAPFYSEETGILFFSSDGHTGIGGLDIYKTHGEDSTWSEPVNMRPPVNSPKDELYYILDDDRLEKGHFTSDRQPCDTCENTNYCYGIYSFQGEPNLYRIEGKVFAQESGEPIPNSLVTFKDVSGFRDPTYAITDEDGHYEKQLQEGVQYFIKAQKIDYFGDALSISTKNLEGSKEFRKDLHLELIPEKEVKIGGIYYDLNKATLRERSKEALDTLVDFLELNDNLVIEVRAHTDVRGPADYNKELSQRRAQSVVDYLVENGIDRERLKAKGLGETELKIENAQTEEEHQENRRTTFKTLRQDYRNLGN